MPDHGLTHIALTVRNLERSLAFYAKFAQLKVVHQREKVRWLSDCTRPFVIVLIETEKPDPALGPISHLGVACASRAEIDHLIEKARLENCLEREPTDSGPPVGYWAFLRDPDGNILELSFGQEINRTVLNHKTSDQNDHK